MNPHYKRYGMALLAGLLLSGCSVEVPEQLFLEGMRSIQEERNYIFALVQFDKFLSKYPEHAYVPVVLIQKAKCHWALREYDEALASCDRVMAAYLGTNKEIEATFLKVDILESQGQWQKAVELCEGLREKMNKVPAVYQDAWFRAASVYVRAEQWPEAVAVYEAMIASASVEARRKPSLHIFKGRSLAEQGNVAEAREVFAGLQEEFPESSEAIWGQVEIARLLQQDDPAASQSHLDKAIEAYRQGVAAAEAQDATDVIAPATPSAPVGSGARQMPALSRAQQREIGLAFQIADAYAYAGRYAEAIEGLEQLKNQYLQDARVYHAVTARVDAIRQTEQMESKAVDAATQEAVSIDPTPLGAVSP